LVELGYVSLEVPFSINSEQLRERISLINTPNKTKAQLRDLKTLEKKYLTKLAEYEEHLDIMGNRNSYSKTHKSVTFMRMKRMP